MKNILWLSPLVALLVAGCNPVEQAVAAESSKAATTNAPPATNASVAPAPASGTATVAATNPPTAEDAVALPKPPPELPAQIQEVVQLAQNTLGEQVLLDFIATIDKPYTLTAEHVIYLKDLGVGENIIVALLKRQVALGGKDAGLTELATADAPDSDPAAAAAVVAETPAGPKLALTNAPGANLGLAATPAPQPEAVPNAPTNGETPGQAPAVPVEQAAPATVNYNTFYQSLSPYGSWVEVADYGWCWQPTVASISVGWRPYCDNGRWVWSSSGWYWSSYYSWGWAPFHYGRWCNVPRRGWCWTPGTVWGPSWVTWRHDHDHFGWAPLPPACGWSAGIGLTFHGSGISAGFSFGLGSSDFCFVPRGRFYDPHCYRYRVPQHELVGVYNHSTVVNNYIINGNNNYIVNNRNGYIVNNGIGRDVVQRATRDEIRPVALADARQPHPGTALPGRTARPDRLEVYRPTIRATDTAAARPPEAVLARQEARTVPAAPRSTGSGSSLTSGGSVGSPRPTFSSRSQGIAEGASANTRLPSRSEVSSPGSSSGSRPTVTSRGSGTDFNSRLESRAASPVVGNNNNSASSPLQARRESRAVVTPQPLNNNAAVPGSGTGVARPDFTGRSEARPGTFGSQSGSVVTQPAPTVTSPSVSRPLVNRSEARPVAQQQLQIRRDTPAVQAQPIAPVTQPSIPGAQPSYSRPDTSSRSYSAPVVRSQPTYQAAPQARYESRPQSVAPSQPVYQAPRSVPQSAPTRSYSAPASSSQGSGQDRSGGRPTPSRHQP